MEFGVRVRQGLVAVGLGVLAVLVAMVVAGLVEWAVVEEERVAGVPLRIGVYQLVEADFSQAGGLLRCVELFQYSETGKVEVGQVIDCPEGTGEGGNWSDRRNAAWAEQALEVKTFQTGGADE